MAHSIAQENYLWQLLKSNEVQNIQCFKFINASPCESKLPAKINSEAKEILKTLKGRIFPIALRGKSQSGKSTTLNRIAQITNVPINSLLPVAENFGSTTTYGLWTIVITFANEDALLLFDMQGTDRGADEITYKLIAFTDHICTKVVDVFRMPVEGFSNEYINTLYCLAMGRDSIENLVPTSNKAILWTNCVLPKQSPFHKEKSCATPEEYHAEVLNCVVGELKMHAEKAKTYTKETSILVTKKPSDEIVLKISQLENEHPFIQNEIIPILKEILSNVQPVKIGSHEIKGGNNYVQYLVNIYNNIQSNIIDLPFCTSPLIRKISTTVLKQTKTWFNAQIKQIKTKYSEDFDWISEKLRLKLKKKQFQGIQRFEEQLSDLPKHIWEEQLVDLKSFIENKIRKIIDKFKISLITHLLSGTYLELHHLCTCGYPNAILKDALVKKSNEIIQRIENIPLLHGNINDTERGFITESLRKRFVELYHTQEQIEHDWIDREIKFAKKLYSSDSEKIDRAIKKMIEDHQNYAYKQFSKFNIQPKIFFDIQKKTSQLTLDNKDRVLAYAEECRNTCLLKFEAIIKKIFLSDRSVPKKYGKLLLKVSECLRRYYKKVPSPWNDETINEVHEQLQQKYTQALDLLYTPEVKKQLKDDRMVQLEAQSKKNGSDNESYLWVHCVACQRIFAGRTQGCKDVTCQRFSKSEEVKSEDHGCGETFESEKAQPVNIAELTDEFWFSNIENGEQKIDIDETIVLVEQNVRGSTTRS